MLLEQNVHICRQANNVEIEGGKIVNSVQGANDLFIPPVLQFRY